MLSSSLTYMDELRETDIGQSNHLTSLQSQDGWFFVAGRQERTPGRNPFRESCQLIKNLTRLGFYVYDY